MRTSKKTNSPKSRYFTFVLYPDNAYHMEYLHYLEATDMGFYIVHKKGDELANIPFVGVYTETTHSEGKAHIHVFLEFKNPRTLSGFLKSFPIMRYYKDENSKQLFTLYDIPYISLPLQEVYKPLIEHAEIIVDPYAYALYMLHRDFKSMALGKRTYDLCDIQLLNVDASYINKYFTDADITDAEIVDIIQQMYSLSTSRQMFLQLVCMHSNPKILKYVQSHAYFINKFITESNEVKIDD